MNKQILKWALAMLAVVGFIALAWREGRPVPEGQPVKDVRWLSDFPEALRVAKADNKPVLIDFVADWCKPCHMMTDEVFEGDTFKAQASRWILLRIDVDKQPDVYAKFGASGLPTLVVLNSEGTAVLGSQGYGGLQQTMDFVTKAFQKATASGTATSPASR